MQVMCVRTYDYVHIVSIQNTEHNMGTTNRGKTQVLPLVAKISSHKLRND